MPTPPDINNYLGLKETASSKATPKRPKVNPNNQPWNPLGSPLPSLAQIRKEAQLAAQREVQAALGALPSEKPLRDRAASSIGAINTVSQQAAQDISGIAKYGVDESTGRINQIGAGQNIAGLNPETDPTALSSANLLSAQSAAGGNTINAAAAGARLFGPQYSAEVERNLLDQLNQIADQRTAINAGKGKAEQDAFDKLREMYLGIAGTQLQGQLSSAELGLNRDKLSAQIATDAAQLDLGRDKLNETIVNNRANTQINLAKLEQAAKGLDLEAGRLALSQGNSAFDQWYKQQQLDVRRWANRIRQAQVEQAIATAKQKNATVDRKSLNSIFNHIDSMYDKKDKTTTDKVTSYSYTFYGSRRGGDPTKPAVKPFTVTGTSFDDAFAKAKRAALADNYGMPNDWHQNVGEDPTVPGYGPVWREERTNPQVTTISRWQPRYAPKVILQTAISRLQDLGYTYDEAYKVAGAYVQALVPGFQLDKFYGQQGGGRRTTG